MAVGKCGVHSQSNPIKMKLMKSLSCVRLFATPWTVAYQVPPTMGFSKQEYWSGLPFPSPGDLPDPGIKRRSSFFGKVCHLCFVYILSCFCFCFCFHDRYFRVIFLPTHHQKSPHPPHTNADDQILNEWISIL